MQAGVWYQMGDKSQVMVRDLLKKGIGVGVILSQRDLSAENAKRYAANYRMRGADVLVDMQFYNPGFSNPKLLTYPSKELRLPMSRLLRQSDDYYKRVAAVTTQLNSTLQTSAVLAPSLVLEAARPEFANTNRRLLQAARVAATDLGLPLLATVALGRSITAADEPLMRALSDATSLDCDGWYFAFEFPPCRVPYTKEDVRRLGTALLMLACTGKPVLHAFAGLLAPLSLTWGATGAAIGHSQNLWKFVRERWEPTSGAGGGGGAPSRFFSSALWGTIVYPDETRRLSEVLRSAVMTPSPYAERAMRDQEWSRWDSHKHLLYVVGKVTQAIAGISSRTDRERQVGAVLKSAVRMHHRVLKFIPSLKDGTDKYQAGWADALRKVRAQRSEEYEYLSLLESASE